MREVSARGPFCLALREGIPHPGKGSVQKPPRAGAGKPCTNQNSTLHSARCPLALRKVSPRTNPNTPRAAQSVPSHKSKHNLRSAKCPLAQIQTHLALHKLTFLFSQHTSRCTSYFHDSHNKHLRSTSELFHFRNFFFYFTNWFMNLTFKLLPFLTHH